MKINLLVLLALVLPCAALADPSGSPQWSHVSAGYTFLGGAEKYSGGGVSINAQTSLGQYFHAGAAYSKLNADRDWATPLAGGIYSDLTYASHEYTGDVSNVGAWFGVHYALTDSLDVFGQIEAQNSKLDQKIKTHQFRYVSSTPDADAPDASCEPSTDFCVVKRVHLGTELPGNSDDNDIGFKAGLVGTWKALQWKLWAAEVDEKKYGFEVALVSERGLFGEIGVTRGSGDFARTYGAKVGYYF